MEWLDGHYTGEVSDGVPHGQGEFDRNQPVEYHPGTKGSDVDVADEFLGLIRLGLEYDVEHHAYTWDECAKYVGEFKQGHPDIAGSQRVRPGAPTTFLIFVPTPDIGFATGKNIDPCLIDFVLLHSAPRIGSVGE